MIPGLVASFIFVSVLLKFPTQAHAIVFLPAVVLIPIANIVAWVVTGATIPGLGIGILWHKMFGKSIIGTIIGVLVTLILIGVSTALFLHWQNPDRPLF